MAIRSLFFFFKQKTAYEVRISDWSSDVCSSDLEAMPDLSLDLRHLRYALAAAQHQSFRRAAATLDVSQSTLTRRVQLLEHRIGFRIFDRGPDRKSTRLNSSH